MMAYAWLILAVIVNVLALASVYVKRYGAGVTATLTFLALCFYLTALFEASS